MSDAAAIAEPSKYCSHCGKQLALAAPVCPNCGAPQPREKEMLLSGYVCAALSLVTGIFSIPAIIIGLLNIGRGFRIHGWIQIAIGVITLLMCLVLIASLTLISGLKHH